MSYIILDITWGHSLKVLLALVETGPNSREKNETDAPSFMGCVCTGNTNAFNKIIQTSQSSNNLDSLYSIPFQRATLHHCTVRPDASTYSTQKNLIVHLSLLSMRV